MEAAFSDVFASKLGKYNCIDCKPIHIKVVENYNEMTVATPTNIPANLQKAATDKIKELCEARIIEEVQQTMVHCSPGQFIPKLPQGRIVSALTTSQRISVYTNQTGL